MASNICVLRLILSFPPIWDSEDMQVESAEGALRYRVTCVINWYLEHEKSSAFGLRILCLEIRWLFIMETEVDMKSHTLHFTQSLYYHRSGPISCEILGTLVSPLQAYFFVSQWQHYWFILPRALLFQTQGAELDHSYLLWLQEVM